MAVPTRKFYVSVGLTPPYPIFVLDGQTASQPYRGTTKTSCSRSTSTMPPTRPATASWCVEQLQAASALRVFGTSHNPAPWHSTCCVNNSSALHHWLGGSGERYRASALRSCGPRAAGTCSLQVVVHYVGTMVKC